MNLCRQLLLVQKLLIGPFRLAHNNLDRAESGFKERQIIRKSGRRRCADLVEERQKVGNGHDCLRKVSRADRFRTHFPLCAAARDFLQQRVRVPRERAQRPHLLLGRGAGGSAAVEVMNDGTHLTNPQYPTWLPNGTQVRS